MNKIAIVAALFVGATAVLVLSGQISFVSQGNWPSRFQSNGERIYFTSSSASGDAINPRGGNTHMGMMSNSGCASCHGADRLGRRLMPNFWTVAPPLTPDALFGGHDDDGHGDHDAYSDESLQRAITEGIDAGGAPLDRAMPRWSMSEADLADVIAFLKSPAPK